MLPEAVAHRKAAMRHQPLLLHIRRRKLSPGEVGYIRMDHRHLKSNNYYLLRIIITKRPHESKRVYHRLPLMGKRLTCTYTLYYINIVYTNNSNIYIYIFLKYIYIYTLLGTNYVYILQNIVSNIYIIQHPIFESPKIIQGVGFQDLPPFGCSATLGTNKHLLNLKGEILRNPQVLSEG